MRLKRKRLDYIRHVRVNTLRYCSLRALVQLQAVPALLIVLMTRCLSSGRIVPAAARCYPYANERDAHYTVERRTIRRWCHSGIAFKMLHVLWAHYIV